MYAVGTLANKNALYDLSVFLFTLQLWNNELPKLYIYCDSYIEQYLTSNKVYKGELFIKKALDSYTDYDRSKMENLKGVEFPTLFGDFVCEKMNLLNWMFESEKSVLFCDADICFLGPLPQVDKTKKLILSRHMIQENDEKRFGIYNAGFLYMSDSSIPNKWKNYTYTSKFFEQLSMEDLANEFQDSLGEFPVQNNYGWWRLFQGRESIQTLQSKWGIKRTSETSGISVEDKPLLSVHTHWKTNDTVTNMFNKFILTYLEKVQSSVLKTKKFVCFLKN
jgi:hypothetical protein